VNFQSYYCRYSVVQIAHADVDPSICEVYAMFYNEEVHKYDIIFDARLSGALLHCSKYDKIFSCGRAHLLES